MPNQGSGRDPLGIVERLLGNPVVLSVATAALAVALSWSFIAHPGSLAATRDPAQPTWRAQALLSDRPAVLIEKRGPEKILSGGYRVATPLLGALLNRIADVGTSRFTALLQVGLPLLASLALAGFAYRSRKDPLAFLFTMWAAAGLFLTRMFLGYQDDQLSLALLAVALAFLEPARRSWGARSAVAILVFLSVLTHLPTALVFLAALAAGGGVGLVARRFSVRRTLADLGPALAAAGVGAALGIAVWYVGAWGASTTLHDAFTFQPYPATFFRHRLHDWVRDFRLSQTWPLYVAGLLWLVWRVVRRRADAHVRLTLLWALPMVGVLGYVVGLRYTYYRFLNATLAPMLVAGAGAWVLARIFLWVGRRATVLVVVGLAGLVLVGFTLWRPVRGGMRLVDHQSQWVGGHSRVYLAAAGAYADHEGERPLVFLMRPPLLPLRGWGVANQWAHIILAGVHGDQVARTYFFVGGADDFLAGRPWHTGNSILDGLSSGFLEDTNEGLARWGTPPIAFLVQSFNKGPLSHGATTVPLVPGVSILQGDGMAPVDPGAIPFARRAAEAAQREVAARPGLFDEPWHMVRIGLGLLILLVVPGALAARWFGLDGFADWLAFLPGLSLGMALTSAFVVEAVGRAPMGSLQAWLSVGVAIAAGVALRFTPALRVRSAPSVGSADEGAGHAPDLPIPAGAGPGHPEPPGS